MDILVQGTKRMCTPLNGMWLNSREEALRDSTQAELLEWDTAQQPAPTTRGAVAVLTQEESVRTCSDWTPSELYTRLRNLGAFNTSSDQQHSHDQHIPSNHQEWLHHFSETKLQFGSAYAWATFPAQYAAHLNRVSARRFQLTSYVHPHLLQAGSAMDVVQKDTSTGQLFIPSPPISPRRIWDLASNKVVPGAYIGGFGRAPYAISHAWAQDMELTWSPVNYYQWPVPVPAGIDLEEIRLQLVSRGVRYCWLDVLCLRQQMPGPGNYPERDPGKYSISIAWELVAETKERSIDLESIRIKEWQVDVPTIGMIYVGVQGVPYYLNGLGRSLVCKLMEIDEKDGTISSFSDRHWLNRAWVLQEIIAWEHMHILSKIENEDKAWFNGVILPALNSFLATVREGERQWQVDKVPFQRLIAAMRARSCTNPMDKLLGLMYLCPSLRAGGLPLYDQSTDVGTVWARHVSRTKTINGSPVAYVVDLLLSWPTPSKGGGWCPEWSELMQVNTESQNYQATSNQESTQTHENTDQRLQLCLSGRMIESNKEEFLRDFLELNNQRPHEVRLLVPMFLDAFESFEVWFNWELKIAVGGLNDDATTATSGGWLYNFYPEADHEDILMEHRERQPALLFANSLDFPHGIPSGQYTAIGCLSSCEISDADWKARRRSYSCICLCKVLGIATMASTIGGKRELFVRKVASLEVRDWGRLIDGWNMNMAESPISEGRLYSYDIVYVC